MIIKKQPVLSILVPTYNYKIGLIRLLSKFRDLSGDKYEIIIYDNSPKEETKEYMSSWIKEHANINLTYQLNRPTTSAPINWNNLISNAKGKYCLLLHNGEIPEESSFFKSLIDRLEKEEPDLALVNCVLVYVKNQKSNYHLPFWLKSTVIKFFPRYIFRQNVIGPTSTLIVKKSLYAKFDENLKWLLDVDSYYRSLIVSKSIKVYKDLRILSIQENSDTLTSQLGDGIYEIEKKERAYLSSKYKNIFWNEGTNSTKNMILRNIENIAWKLIVKTFSICQRNLNNELKQTLNTIWNTK